VMTLTEAAEVVVQVSKALSRAHAANIVHRDLKPENLFLVWDDEDQKTVVKVVDFGIAKFSDGTGIDSATRTGAVLGTPHFMSPEQARGLKSVDHAADIWSLAVITYRAVTGRAPFEGEAVGDLLVKICTVEPVPPSELVAVPEGFDVWVARSLAKEARDRFPSVAAQAEALVRLVDGVELGLSTMDGVDGRAAGSEQKRTPVDKFGPPKSRGAAPALTSASTDGGIADTEAGLERPRTGRAPSTRRLWWVLPPLVAMGALGLWMAQAPDEPVEPLSSMEIPTSQVATSQSAGAAAPSALTGMLPPKPSPAQVGTPDAGPPSPAVELGRPADSATTKPAGTAQKPSSRRKDPRPGQARPPSKAPTDELGY
jgi:serine/threonine protein kinase